MQLEVISISNKLPGCSITTETYVPQSRVFVAETIPLEERRHQRGLVREDVNARSMPEKFFD